VLRTVDDGGTTFAYAFKEVVAGDDGACKVFR
jgi:hypothetical protein